MTVRSLTAAAVIMICTAAGAVFSSVPERRCAQLELICLMLDELSQKIRFTGEKLSPLLCGLSLRKSGRRCYFLHDLCELCESGLTAGEAWRTAAGRAMFLSEDDRRTLSDIGAGLGESDTQGQMSLLSYAGELMEKRLSEAREEKAKGSRLILSMFALCGIGAGILIV